MKNYINKLSIFCTLIVFFSCGKRHKNDRGVEYMADLDMYYSVAVKEYTPSTLFKGETSAMLPPKGSVPKGDLEYYVPNTNKGYKYSKKIKSPIEENLENIKEGKILYGKFCSHCHGEQGKGMGKLVELGLYGGVPDYSKPPVSELTEGTIFHVITHGKNAMGSHSGQIDIIDRWKIVKYVQKLQKGN